MKLIIITLQKREHQSKMFRGEFYKYFRKKCYNTLYVILFHKIERTLSNSLYEVSLTVIPKPVQNTTTKES